MTILLLFISGAAGLVYEVVWARYLALFLGHTAYAVMMVLAAFMGGLALGSYWLGARADRSPAPLRLFGLLELGIGLYGLVFPWLFSLSRTGFTDLLVTLQPGVAVRVPLQLIFSASTILVPTVMMGGTLPMLVKLLTHSVPEVHGRVAALYAMNSAGAVAGCLLADFWLIPGHGLGATVQCAVGLNFLAGLGALALNRRLHPGAPSPEPAHGESGALDPPGAGDRSLALLAIGASGFVAMLYEVAWTRMLALVMGSSTHAFSIMLATFIAGIAFGAWILTRWRTLRRIPEAFGWIEIAVGASVLLSTLSYSYLPYWFASVGNIVVRTEETYPLYLFIQAAACFGVAFVPTAFLGMTLPLAGRMVAREMGSVGGSVGRVFAVNTLGTVLGALTTGFLLMPWFGLARTFALGAGINAAIGLALLGRRNRTLQLALAGSALALTAGVLAFSVPWFDQWPQRMIQGLWRRPVIPTDLEGFVEMSETIHLRYYSDGAGASVGVNALAKPGERPRLFLTVNGKPDASTAADMPTQLLLGHIPMLLHPAAKEALVIGLGGGMTCGAIAVHPSIDRIDVVEISPEVAEAAREFSPENGNVLADPRLHIALEDAKTYLQTTPRTYDVIVSEPSNPWVAGVAGLFSEEFYETCRAKLSDNGLMTQWVQLYETNDEAVEIVLRTFTSVFPYTSVWHIPQELILVGSDRPIALSIDALVERFNVPAVREDLRRIDLTSVPLLLSCELVSPENAAFVTPPDGPRHRDLFPVLEYAQQRAFFARSVPTRWAAFDESELPRPVTLLGWYLSTHEPTVDDIGAFAKSLTAQRFPTPRLVRSLIARWREHHPDEPAVLDLLSALPSAEPPSDAELRQLITLRDSLWATAPADPNPLFHYRDVLWQNYLSRVSAFYVPPSDELQSVLGRLLETDPAHQRFYKLELAKLAWDAGRDSECVRLAASAIDPAAGGDVDFDLNSEVVPEVLVRFAELLWRAGDTQSAIRVCALAMPADSLNPRVGMIYRKLLSNSGSEITGASP